ncbi:hypothetical protein [Streptomyces sp. NPDC002952]|uniref:hypothetical protein n=1 Tax=Streptomyces sp. NPDC002952 TaxID=3364673 RepID=UPI00368B29F3
MHRTTTTATLLVTVAVSALTGCMTVPRSPAPGPPPSLPVAPRPDGSAEPRVVQAPAREALERVGPSRRPSPTPPAPHRTTAPPAPVGPSPAPPRPRHENLPPKRQRPEARAAVPPAPRGGGKNADVCALGRKYGGWAPDSPQAVICKGAYGR